MAGFFAEDMTDVSTSGISTDMVVIGNTPYPLMSDTPETSVDSAFGGIKQLLGSIGTTARDLGTAVGSARAAVRNAGPQFDAAKNAAERPVPLNRARQWFMFASDTDKIMVALAIVGIAFAAYQVSKG